MNQNKDTRFVVEEFRGYGDWNPIKSYNHPPSARAHWAKLTFEGRNVRMSRYQRSGRVDAQLPAIGGLFYNWLGNLTDGKKLISSLNKTHRILEINHWVSPIVIPSPILRHCISLGLVVEGKRIVHFPTKQNSHQP